MVLVGEAPKGVTGAPAEISELTKKFASGLNVDEASQLTRALNEQGAAAFESSNVVETLQTSLTEKTAGSLKAFSALAANVDAWIHPHLIQLLPLVVSAMSADAADVKSAANDAVEAAVKQLVRHAGSEEVDCVAAINSLEEGAAFVKSAIAEELAADSARGLSAFQALSSRGEAWLSAALNDNFSAAFAAAIAAENSGAISAFVARSLAQDAAAFAATVLAGGASIFEKGYLVEAFEGAVASKDANAQAGALAFFEALHADGSAWAEPYLVKLLPSTLTLFSAKSNEVSSKVDEVVRSFIGRVNPKSMKHFLQVIFSGMDVKQNWQTKAGATALLGFVATSYPEEVGIFMLDVVVELTKVVSDTKKQVKEAANAAFLTVGGTIQNGDIKELIPALLKAYSSPVKETVPTLDKLLGTTFVNSVDSPTLGIIVPFLLRSFAERKTVMKRRSAVVVDSMCKLVDDPRDAANFYPIIEPCLKKCIDEVAIEEIRNTCERSLNALKNVMGEALEKKAAMKSEEEMASIITTTVSKRVDTKGYEAIMDYVSSLCHHLVDRDESDIQLWNAAILPYLGSLVGNDGEAVVTEIYGQCSFSVPEQEEYDDAEDLVNHEFSLAYASRVLLHQTRLHLKKGRTYGLIGRNGCGKSTLMISIANGSLQGFPEDLRTVYVEHGIQGSHAETPVIEFVESDPKIHGRKTKEQCEEQLRSVGFTEDMIVAPIETLSGGWRMKLALSRAMLTDPQMLLLDEPTNHLDVNAVAWITNYVQNLKEVTSLIVSHDTGFLDAVCSDVLHYEPNLKLKRYKGNVTEFVKQNPAAKVYFELSADEEQKFKFPKPGHLEGVKSTTKAILSMRGLSFQYKSAPRPQLSNVNAQCSLASRVAVIGANGAGKSTLIKLMVGELDAAKDGINSQGEHYKHPNLVVAYVAQHAFHHIEQHLDKSPVEYIEWRFHGGIDKEQQQKEQIQTTEEEEAAIRAKAKAEKRGVVEEIKHRRQGKREYEYEVIWEGGILPPSFVGRKELEEMGYGKMVQAFDEQVAMEQAQGKVKLTHGNIEKHLGNFGLGSEHASHNKIGALSGGQKVKVVLGAAMWNNPHLLILDEPTNFLDRDSLGGLAEAIKEFEGGVLMISHSREFYEALCPERWYLEAGRLTSEGAEWMEAVELARKRAEREAAKKLPVEKEEKFDSMGNTVKEEKKGADLDRKQKKALMKKRKEMIKAGEDTFEIDELLGLL